jgi:hypothetical protein
MEPLFPKRPSLTNEFGSVEEQRMVMASNHSAELNLANLLENLEELP